MENVINVRSETNVRNVIVMDIEELMKIEKARKRIFKDESVLDVSYIPEKPLFRENELKTIYLELSPLFNGIRATNIFIYGMTGTGKTMIMKYFLERVVPDLGKASFTVT